MVKRYQNIVSNKIILVFTKRKLHVPLCVYVQSLIIPSIIVQSDLSLEESQYNRLSKIKYNK